MIQTLNPDYYYKLLQDLLGISNKQHLIYYNSNKFNCQEDQIIRLREEAKEMYGYCMTDNIVSTQSLTIKQTSILILTIKLTSILTLTISIKLTSILTLTIKLTSILTLTIKLTSILTLTIELTSILTSNYKANLNHIFNYKANFNHIFDYNPASHHREKSFLIRRRRPSMQYITDEDVEKALQEQQENLNSFKSNIDSSNYLKGYQYS